MKPNYSAFLSLKQRRIQQTGFEAGRLNRNLFDFQEKIVRWALKLGRAALFEDTGLGKSLQELAWADAVTRETGGDVLILAPLAVAAQTKREADRWGIRANIAKDASQIQPGINITNYDRLEKFEGIDFAGVVADESSAIKAESGRTTQYILNRFASTRFKLAGTATPAPNDYMELGTHAEFMGVMTRSEMLATFFTHDGGETSKWRLKGHAEQEFWRWVSTWAICITSPADIGFDGSAYVLPPLNRHWHTVEGTQINDGMLIPMPASTLSERRGARRDSIEARLELARRIVSTKPAEQWVIWCNLNAESNALAKGIPNAVELTGSEDRDIKEQKLLDFCEGKIQNLVTKGEIAGFGINMQNCHNTIHFGLSDSYEELYQTDRRFYRFGQKYPVDSHVITSTQETAVVENIKRKERDAIQMKKEMAKIVSSAFLEEQAKADYQPKTLITFPNWMTAA